MNEIYGENVYVCTLHTHIKQVRNDSSIEVWYEIFKQLKEYYN